MERDDRDGPGRDWVSEAERDFDFERRTAQRLAFIRWLRSTGRLPDDTPSAQEIEAFRAAENVRVQRLRGPWPSWK
jgi:hypothetical protein